MKPAKARSQAWLDQRKKTLGGSDAATVLGLNPYESAYYLWAYKRGLIGEKEETEAMRQGRDLEEYVAQRFREATGKRTRRKNGFIYNDDYPFAHANVDRLIVGENAGLECKTTASMNLRRFKNGEYPDAYYCQCVHYLAVTGADRWYLAVLVLGREFLWFEIERDEEEIAALMQAERDFMEQVRNNVPPPVDGSPSTAKALDAIFGHDATAMTRLFGHDEDVGNYLAVCQQIKALEKQRDYFKQVLLTEMGDAGQAETSCHRITRRLCSRQTFDIHRFLADHPEAFSEKYIKNSVYQQFIVKEREEPPHDQ